MWLRYLRRQDSYSLPETYDRAREFGLDPTVCALSGGEDYELLFTIAQADYESLENI